MTGTPPLDLVYTAVFGEPPGAEVAGALGRLERYLHGDVTQSTALMLCIQLRPLDLHVQATAAATRQMHEARTLLELEVNALRSNDAVTIARLHAAIGTVIADNDRLRRATVECDVAWRSRGGKKGAIATLAVVVLITLVVLRTVGFR